jgi:hypothetical protein
MTKAKRNTATNRRAHRPSGGQRPYKPIPVITEQFRGKQKVDEKAKKLSLIKRIEKWGRSFLGLFRWKKKRNVKTKSFKPAWIKEDRPQWDVDRQRRKKKIKARNRRNRKATRRLHQMERRRVL